MLYKDIKVKSVDELQKLSKRLWSWIMNFEFQKSCWKLRPKSQN